MPATELSPAYVLHARRYGDTSLLVELFGREFGRAACVAKGAVAAKRSPTRLQPFQPLLVALRGRGEVQTLINAELDGRAHSLAGRKLYCGFYLNELLLKLTARSDPNPPLFRLYTETLLSLALDEDVESLLRRFETKFVADLGHRLVLENDCNGQPIDPAAFYRYHIDRGPEVVTDGVEEGYPGTLLQALRRGHFDTPQIQRQARLFMRRILDHYLEGRPIRSRDLFR